MATRGEDASVTEISAQDLEGGNGELVVSADDVAANVLGRRQRAIPGG